MKKNAGAHQLPLFFWRNEDRLSSLTRRTEPQKALLQSKVQKAFREMCCNTSRGKSRFPAAQETSKKAYHSRGDQKAKTNCVCAASSSLFDHRPDSGVAFEIKLSGTRFTKEN